MRYSSWVYLHYLCMYLYAIACLLVVYVVFFIIFRLKHRFWAIQPVFHYHNLRYWLFPPGIITQNQFPMTKYYKPFQIDVNTFDEISSIEFDNIHQLISQHYLQDKNLQYNPTKTNIQTYFKGHNSPCYVAQYKSSDVLSDRKKGTIQLKQKPISVLTSRPLHVSLYNNDFVSHYVDYL